MPLLASTGLRNKVLDTGSVKNVLANGRIHVYASTLANIPASADDAIVPANHTLLLTVYGDGVSTGLNLGTASGGAIGKAAGRRGQAPCWPAATLRSSVTWAAPIRALRPPPSHATRAAWACPAQS